MGKFHWRLYKRESDDLIAHLCAIRGIQLNALLPNFEEHLHDPNLLPDMAVARQLVVQAVKEGWFVTVFGDYDADGTPASALLSTVLNRLGINHQVILPTRTSGYGLSLEVIDSIKESTQLLITVDTGITAVKEISRAKELGIKTIVIDHHLPAAVLPPAEALIDPFLPKSKYPFAHLCGCALAYKLAVALSQDFPKQLTEGFLKWLLDIVAISTVADMMPLVGENRVLVHYGLQVLAKTRRPGLTELMKSAGISPDSLNSYSLGFALGPRLNASGRLEDNRPAYDLLVAHDSSTARRLAMQIENANQQRQDLVKDIQAQAETLIWQQNDRDDRFLIVANQGWPAGVLGLVAGKLSAQYNRPTAVLTFGPDGYSGSARSTDRYSLVDGLTSVKQHLVRFGGHKQAAGLATSAGEFPNFTKAIKNHARQMLSKDDLIARLNIDAELNPSEIKLETARQLNTLAPFGHANPSPLFYVGSASVVSSRRIGSSNNHLKLMVKAQGEPFEVIGFGLADDFFSLETDEVDLIGSLEVNRWNNRDSLQMKVKDFRIGGVGVDETIALPNG